MNKSIDKKEFKNLMIDYAVLTMSLSLSRRNAAKLISKYENKIDMSDQIIQNIGSEYFTNQILMNEKKIEYTPI